MKNVREHFITGQQLPLVLESTDRNVNFGDFIEWIKAQKPHIEKHLLRYGGVLFRNFPVHNEHDFENVIKALGLGKFIDYIGGDSPRTKITGGVYTSTEAPPQVKIPLHNELSFVKHFPQHIYFYCNVAPNAKGETILADARKVYQAIDSEVRKKFDEKQLNYVSCYFRKSKLMDLINRKQKAHKTWLDVFETDDKAEVEKKCRESEFDFEWTKNDWIRISQTRPATYTHPLTREKVWFNQVHLYDFNPKWLGWWRHLAVKALYCRKHMKLHEVFFGDKSPIPRDEIYHILDILDANTVSFPWQKGDVLVLDNVLAMHGRATFTGKRRILTAMTGV